MTLSEQVAQLEASHVAAQQQVTALNATISRLEAEIVELKKQIPPSTPEPTPEPTPTPANFKIGVYVPGTLENQVQYHNNFSAWIGVDMKVAQMFAGSATWSTISSLFNYPQTWKAWLDADPQRLFNISIPLLPDEAAQQWDHPNLVAAHQAAVNRIVASGNADQIIARIGWEMNGSWSKPWAWQAVASPGVRATTADQFKIAAAGYVRAFRKVAPLYRKAGIKVDWCTASFGTNAGVPASAWYPGDDMVDIIAMDRYDRVWPQSLDFEERWRKVAPDFDALIAFSKAHNKPWALCEWACWDTATNGGGDNPRFIRGVAEKIKSSGNCAYVIYFNSSGGGVGHRLQDFPKAAAEFKLQFKA